MAKKYIDLKCPKCQASNAFRKDIYRGLTPSETLVCNVCKEVSNVKKWKEIHLGENYMLTKTDLQAVEKRIDDIVDTIKDIQRETNRLDDRIRQNHKVIADLQDEVSENEAIDCSKFYPKAKLTVYPDGREIFEIEEQEQFKKIQESIEQHGFKKPSPEKCIKMRIAFKRNLLNLVRKHREVCLDEDDDRIDGEECNVSLGVLLQYLQSEGMEFSDQERKLFL